jgi:pyrroline-5-carboxylate reductase
MDISTLSIGFIGAGRMATALAQGFCRNGLTTDRITAVDPDSQARHAFLDSVGQGTTVHDKPCSELLQTDVLILAVKPQIVPQVLAGLENQISASQLIISIAAGINLSTIEDSLPAGSRVIRVMPNTPCLVGSGACGISAGNCATSNDLEIVHTLLESVGIVEVIPEKLMDALTGLSGSGPAYVFQMIEALSDGGVQMGLPRTTATRLASQTLLGSAQMVLETGEHPGQLKDAVTSPGGTTIAGVHALEAGGLRAALMNAVRAATERSAELG